MPMKALLVVMEKSEQHKCPLMGQLINKLWFFFFLTRVGIIGLLSIHLALILS